MVNVDLKTSNDERPAVEISTDFSLLIMIILTIIVLAVGGALYVWKGTLIKDIAVKDEAIKTEVARLSRPETKQVIDFQNRAKVAKGLLSEGNSAFAKIATGVEDAMVPDVYINSLSYDGGMVTVAVVAKDYFALAKQIASFKQATGSFSEVSADAAKVNSEGKVEAPISLKVN